MILVLSALISFEVVIVVCLVVLSVLLGSDKYLKVSYIIRELMTNERFKENLRLLETKVKDVSVHTARSVFNARKGLVDTTVGMRKGRPISSEVYVGDGVVPHPVISSQTIQINRDIYEFFEWLYRADPMVASAVDHYTVFATQNGFKLLSVDENLVKYIENWFEAVKMKTILRNIFRCLYLFGDCYVWKDFRRKNHDNGFGVISNLRVLHPAWIYIKQNEFGEVVGYLQKKSSMSGEYTYFTKEEIMHMKYKEIADRAYSTSMIECMLRDLHYERYSEHSLAEVFHDYISPLLHVSCGTDNAPGGGQRPADEASIERVKQYIESLQPNEDLITDNTVKINVISPGRSIGDYNPALDHFRSNALMGTQLPFWFFGLTTNITEASAIVIKEMVEKHVGSDQEMVGETLEKELLPYLMLGYAREIVANAFSKNYGELPDQTVLNSLVNFQTMREIINDGTPKIKWNPIESFQRKSERLLKELNAGATTINEYRKEFGRPAIDNPLADLPLPILEIERMKLQMEYQIIIRQNRLWKQQEEERELPKRAKPNSETVDVDGKPIAKDVKTHRRK